MKKFNIVNALIRRHGYRNYLEICTPLTGMAFHRVDKTSLEKRHRLMYRCPPEFRDGNEITFRSENNEIAGLLSSQPSYDIMFVDSWHTYECSLRDLREAFSNLSPGGVIVTHDCFPEKREHTSNVPPRRWSLWTGLTYCAYLDFTLSQAGLEACVVDSDSGCGVIKKTGDLGFAVPRDTEIAHQWHRHRAQRGFDVFDFFDARKNELCNVLSIDDFLTREGIDRRVHRSSLAYILDRTVAEIRHNVATRPHRLLVRRLEREGWLA